MRPFVIHGLSKLLVLILIFIFGKEERFLERVICFIWAFNMKYITVNDRISHQFRIAPLSIKPPEVKEILRNKPPSRISPQGG